MLLLLLLGVVVLFLVGACGRPHLKCARAALARARAAVGQAHPRSAVVGGALVSRNLFARFLLGGGKRRLWGLRTLRLWSRPGVGPQVSISTCPPESRHVPEFLREGQALRRRKGLLQERLALFLPTLVRLVGGWSEAPGALVEALRSLAGMRTLLELGEASRAGSLLPMGANEAWRPAIRIRVLKHVTGVVGVGWFCTATCLRHCWTTCLWATQVFRSRLLVRGPRRSEKWCALASCAFSFNTRCVCVSVPSAIC